MAASLPRADAQDAVVEAPAEPPAPAEELFRFRLMLAALAATSLVGLLVIVRVYAW